YGQKLEMVTDMVQELSSQGQVTIIGASAGGSMALNAFLEKPEIIHRVISICSRLRPGTLDKLDWRTLDRMASSSKAFKESVERIAEQVIPDTLKDKIMTVTARFGDELVPKTTSFIEGAYNITIPFGEHVVSILLTLTLFRGRIIEFIQLNESE
ncbi:MAG: alpha/beta fold hydrolase, partial [Candidatus Dojkabacteria bacterium]|nr:alpha/beta fold hydrolase [Candidatus Dojkabacteria bacterium]